MLVNTESFQTIDEGDGTTNIQMRFGQNVQEKLFYDISGRKFQFTRGLSVAGAITATGSITASGTIRTQGSFSGRSLTIDGNGSFSGDLLVKNRITAKGAISGASLNVSRNATVSGSLNLEGNLTGSTINGFGLPSGGCNVSTQKLTWNAATGKFECATDLNTGSSYTAGQGLSLNGTTFSTNPVLSGSLLRFLTISGGTIFAKNTLASSGSLKVLGNMSGSSLTVSRNANISGALVVKGNISTHGSLSGSSLRVGGPAEIHGTLTASGNVRTDGDLTINDDAGATDAVLTFGNATTNQTLKYLNSAQKFQFSKGLSVVGHLSGSSLNIDGNATVGGTLTATGSIRTKGNLSGSTLTVDGSITLRGITYNAPTSQSAGTFLKTDGAGNLTWENTSVGNGSGNILSLHPEYPNAIYFSSGSSFIGQMTASGGTSALENSYVWTSTRATLQDYWVSARVRLPDNFSSWDPMRPIQLRYKTGVAAAANNHVSVRMKDTAGADVVLTNGGGLANTSWTTATVTGPQAGGTWTPKEYFTVYVKLAANSTAGANAAAGFLNFNWETTTP